LCVLMQKFFWENTVGEPVTVQLYYTKTEQLYKTEQQKRKQTIQNRALALAQGLKPSKDSIPVNKIEPIHLLINCENKAS
jgi:hypothetical protein